VQQLLSVGCLSIAAKMEETLVPRCLDFQVGQTCIRLCYIRKIASMFEEYNGVSKSSLFIVVSVLQ